MAGIPTMRIGFERQGRMVRGVRSERVIVHVPNGDAIETEWMTPEMAERFEHGLRERLRSASVPSEPTEAA